MTRINRNTLSSAVKDGNSTQDAGLRAQALVLDAGMSVVTFDGGSSRDTYGVDDMTMTTLWPDGPSGILKMSDHFSRSTYLPISGSSGSHLQNLVELSFKIATLKAKSKSVPLCWPITFTVEGTLEMTL